MALSLEKRLPANIDAGIFTGRRCDHAVLFLSAKAAALILRTATTAPYAAEALTKNSNLNPLRCQGVCLSLV